MRDAWAATERFRGYGAAVAFVGVCTGVVALVRVAGDVNNASMLYLVAVLATAVFFGSGPAVFGAIASFLAYNFFFIPPRYELTVAEDEDEAHYLHVYIARLRKKIEPDSRNPRYIATEPGVGYRLISDET